MSSSTVTINTHPYHRYNYFRIVSIAEDQDYKILPGDLSYPNLITAEVFKYIVVGGDLIRMVLLTGNDDHGATHRAS